DKDKSKEEHKQSKREHQRSKDKSKKHKKSKDKPISEERKKVLEAFQKNPERFMEENKEHYMKQVLSLLREMFTQEATENGVDPTTLDLETMATNGMRQVVASGRLFEIVAEIILREDDNDKPNLNTNQQILESVLSDSKLPPWIKEEMYVEEMLCINNKCSSKDSNKNMVESRKPMRLRCVIQFVLLIIVIIFMFCCNYVRPFFNGLYANRFDHGTTVFGFSMGWTQITRNANAQKTSNTTLTKVRIDHTHRFIAQSLLNLLKTILNSMSRYVCCVLYVCALLFRISINKCNVCNASVRSIFSLFVTFGNGSLSSEEKKTLFPLVLHVIFNWEKFTFDVFQLAMKLSRRLVTWIEPTLVNVPVLDKTGPINPSSIVKRWIELIGEITHRKAETPSKEEIASNMVVSQFTQASIRKASSIVSSVLPIDEDNAIAQAIAESTAIATAENKAGDKIEDKVGDKEQTKKSKKSKRRSSLLLQSAAATVAQALPTRRFCVVAQGQESSKVWKEVLLSPEFEFLLPEDKDGGMHYCDTDEEEWTEEDTDTDDPLRGGIPTPSLLDLLLENPELQRIAAELEREKEKAPMAPSLSQLGKKPETAPPPLPVKPPSEAGAEPKKSEQKEERDDEKSQSRRN
ncbi:hypothetical protein RFI_06022, partial [Reticulomyxa filosa]